MESSSKPKISLTFGVFHDEQWLRRETVTQAVTKVGRDTNIQLRLDEPAAARLHAVIEVISPTEIYLIDLGSELGTKVNGVAINKCTIKRNDRIGIGRSHLILEGIEGVPQGQ